MYTLQYNPANVAELEVSWWKAHHAKDKQAMLAGLVAQFAQMYGLEKEEAQTIVSHFATGIKHHDTRDWNSAVEAVEKAYEVIKSRLKLQLNTRRAAELEVGWWQLHDKLEFIEDKTPLAQNFAALYAEVFGLNEESLFEAGKFKAEATRQHDLAETEGASNDQIAHHWVKAEEYLLRFYETLKNEVNKA